MNTYFSTFIPGLGEIVKEQLERSLVSFHCQLLLDGLIVFQTKSAPEVIKNLGFLNNSFLEVQPEEKLPFKPGKTFRVVFSKENELVRVNRERLTKIENKISQLNNITVDRASPDFEIWFLERSEGNKLVGVRITKHPDYKTVLQKGQLRPELANLMCLISKPLASDTILDPFTGSGAIPNERSKFPYKKIVAGDITGDGKRTIKLDATNLKEIPDQSIGKIITDPPWGVSVGLDLDLPNFYEKVLRQFHRVLRPGGLIVILIGQKALFETVLAKFAGQFQLQRRFDILVSGKKATIYQLVKK